MNRENNNLTLCTGVLPSPTTPATTHDGVRDESFPALFGLLDQVCPEIRSVDFEVVVRAHMLFDSLLVADRMKSGQRGR